MNRRGFLKHAAAASLVLVPALVLPEQTRSYLFGSWPELDDQAYVQGLLDQGRSVPPGNYRLHNTLRVTQAGTRIYQCQFVYSRPVDSTLYVTVPPAGSPMTTVTDCSFIQPSRPSGQHLPTAVTIGN